MDTLNCQECELSAEIIHIAKEMIGDADVLSMHPSQFQRYVHLAMDEVPEDKRGFILMMLAFPNNIMFCYGMRVEQSIDVPQDELHFKKNGEVIYRLFNLAV
jgi:hypothetical protein